MKDTECDFFETPYFNSDGTKKILEDNPSFCEKHVVFNSDQELSKRFLKDKTMMEMSTPAEWPVKSPEEIQNDIKEMSEVIRGHNKIKPEIIIISGPSNMSRKGVLQKVVDKMNVDSLVTVSLKEVDDLFKDESDRIVVFRPTALPSESEIMKNMLVQDLIDTSPKCLTDSIKKTESKGKPRNFKDRPPIPNKKRRWKK